MRVRILLIPVILGVGLLSTCDVLRCAENDKTEYLAYSYAKSQGIAE